MDVRIGASTFIESLSFPLKKMKIKFLLFTCLLAAVLSKTIQLNPQEFCRDTCKQNTCEGDGRENWSSDQMLSCMMACQMRHIGVSEDECLGHCDRNGQSGCRLTVNGETFNLCGPRDIRGSECDGPVSPSECELGCHSYPEVTSRYERREMHCPNVDPIAQLGRLSTFEECQAACDDREDCGAIRILTRSRHPANNCLFYSNECNENRVDSPCTAIKECFYFERVFEATMCTLSGGQHVFDGWSGNDSGENSCNTCSCESGTLMCTEMACGPTRDITYTLVGNSYCREVSENGDAMTDGWMSWTGTVDSVEDCDAQCKTLGPIGCRAYDFNTSGKCQIYAQIASTVKASQPGRAVCYKQVDEYKYVGNSYCRESDENAAPESMIPHLSWSGQVFSLLECDVKCKVLGLQACKAYHFNTSGKCEIYKRFATTVKASQPNRAVCYSRAEKEKRLFPFVAYEYCSKSGAKDSRDYALTFGVHPASEQACEEFCNDWDECTAFSFWSREDGNQCIAFKECKKLEHLNMLQAKYVITRSSKPLFEFFSLKPFPFMASESYCGVSSPDNNNSIWRDYVTTEGVSPPAEQSCAKFCSDWDECVAYSFWSLEKGNQCMAFKQCDHVTTSTAQAKYVMTRSSTPLLPEEETSSGKNRRLLQFHE